MVINLLNFGFSFDNVYNKGAYLTFKSGFHKALNFDSEITLNSVPGINHY